MSDNMTIRQFIERFNNGDFDHNDVSTQIEAGWYDWFCKDTSLRNKTKVIGNIIKQLKDGGKVDLDKMYVFFKNNCPCSGGLYDDFRICDINTGAVLINVNIDNPYDNLRYSVYGRFPEGEFWSMPYLEFSNSKQLVEWLNKPQGELNHAIKLKADVKEMISNAQKNDDDNSIRCEDISLSNEAIVAKLKFRGSNKSTKELTEALKAVKGFDVEVKEIDDGYIYKTVLFTFKEPQKGDQA